MGTVLVLGATSVIARAVAGEFAVHGHNLVLAGRDAVETEAVASDIALRHGVTARTEHFDALAFDTHQELPESCLREGDAPLDGVVLCFAYQGEQEVGQLCVEEARRTVETTFTAAVTTLNPIANYLERQGRGFICALASVAGDRGRQSNYIYGSAKAGLAAYLQGLRNRLARSGVHVCTVKLGLVDTQLTYGRKTLPLVTSPEAAARGIYRAVARRRDVAYVPQVWWPVMLVIRAIPERVFKRLRL